VAHDASANLFQTMITIGSSKNSSEVALSCLEVTLTTPRSVYSISLDDSMIEPGSSFGGGLFGAISWPVSRFRLAEGLLLEQQMFLPHDGSAVALSWALRGDTVISAHLVVRPFFSGCGPRSYRDVGFGFDSERDGGRLSWLPNVRGPKVIADTNGRYYDEPVRLFDCLYEQAAASASGEDLITPGRFEFELSRRPSVLIFSMEGLAITERNQQVGQFLAGLIQNDSISGSDLAIGCGCGTEVSADPVAA
jgi:glycogen debranching enzyme-like protein